MDRPTEQYWAYLVEAWAEYKHATGPHPLTWEEYQRGEEGK